MNEQNDVRLDNETSEQIPSNDNEVVKEESVPETPVAKTPAAEAPKAAKVKVNMNFKFDLKSKGFIRSAVLLLISFFVLIAAFCPIITYHGEKHIGYYDRYDLEYLEYDMDMGTTAAESIGYFFDSLASKSEKELTKLDLYDDLEGAYEDLYDEAEDIADDDYEDITKEYVKCEEEITEIQLRLMLKSEDVSPTLDSFLVFLLALAFILGAIAFFAASAMNFFCEITGSSCVANVNFLSRKLLIKLASILLVVLPGVMIALYGFSFNCFGLNDVMYFDPSISFIALFSLVLMIGALIARFVFRAIDKEVVIDKNVRNRIISAGLALIMVFALLSPIVNFKFDRDYTYTEKTERSSLKSNLFHGFRLKEYSYVAVDLNAVSGTASNEIGFDGDDLDDSIEELGTSVILMADAVMVFSVLILISNLGQLAFGIIPGKRQLGFRIANVAVVGVLTSFYFIIALAMIAYADSDIVKVSFGMGSMFMIACSVLYFVFMPRDKKIKKVEGAKEEAPAAEPTL